MDGGHVVYLSFLLLYTLGISIALLWFLLRVRPKFPSLLSTVIVVLFAFMVVLFVVTILELAISPLTGSRAISVGYGFEISLVEETMKILIVFLGLFIAKGESSWTDTKLTLALLAGLVFGIMEGMIYISNEHFSATGKLILFMSRMVHPVLTVTLMAGLLLMTKGRKLAGALIVAVPYVTHALLDHYLSMGATSAALVVLAVMLVAFFVGIYLLLPTIESEKRTRAQFQREATVSIEDHWLKKM